MCHKQQNHLTQKQRKEKKTHKPQAWHELDEIIECMQRIKWLTMRSYARNNRMRKKAIPMNSSYFERA
jgi:hypothetical protein